MSMFVFDYVYMGVYVTVAHVVRTWYERPRACVCVHVHSCIGVRLHVRVRASAHMRVCVLVSVRASATNSCAYLRVRAFRRSVKRHVALRGGDCSSSGLDSRRLGSG